MDILRATYTDRGRYNNYRHYSTYKKKQKITNKLTYYYHVDLINLEYNIYMVKTE